MKQPPLLCLSRSIGATPPILSAVASLLALLASSPSAAGPLNAPATGLEAPAGELSPPETEAAITLADLKGHVLALASEEMEGRGVGERGERVATAYVAGMFKRLGLAPAGENGGYFQSFEFPGEVTLAGSNALTFDGAGAEGSPELNAAWSPLGFSASGAFPAAPVAFVGYGLEAPADRQNPAYDSFGDVDLSGRWALIWRGAPPEISDARRTQLMRVAAMRFKASAARARGAVGVIVADGPGAGYRAGLPSLGVSSAAGPVSYPVIAVDAVAASSLLRAGGVDPEASARLLADGTQASDVVALQGVSVAATISLTREMRTGRNVLARLSVPGADPDAAPILVGGHVDHLGRGGGFGSRATAEEVGQIHYGADDNASGVAATLEIAEHLAAQAASGVLKGARDVVFTAWSGEELGLIGSTHYVDAAQEAAGTDTLQGVVAAYLNMDMIGRLEAALQLSGVGTSSIWPEEIARGNARVGLALALTDSAYTPTDAMAFYLGGAPVLSAFTGVHGDYHTPRDRPELLNFDGLRDVTRLMGEIAASLASAETPPDYVETPRPAASEDQPRLGGVSLGTIPAYVQGKGEGVALSGVVTGGAAEIAGLRSGDAVVGLAGRDVEDIYDLVRALNGLKAGEPIEIVVLRDGARVTATITPQLRE